MCFGCLSDYFFSELWTKGSKEQGIKGAKGKGKETLSSKGRDKIASLHLPF